MIKDFKNEVDYYPTILKWLQIYLENKNTNSIINTYDTHSINLSDLIRREKLTKYFPDYSTYEIRVDLIGTILENQECDLVFVEVKKTSLSLINLSQILGYCKIFQPKQAFLISPTGFSKSLNRFLIHYRRLDILEFEKNKYIRVAKWNTTRNSIETDSIFPPLGNI